MNVTHTVTNHSQPASEAVDLVGMYILHNSHSLTFIPTYPIFAQLKGFAQVVHDRWDEIEDQRSFSLFLAPFLSSFLSLCVLFIKHWSKVNLYHVRVCCTYLYIFRVCAVIFPRSKSWKYTVGASSFLSPPAQGFLHCVTTELKGGICDLISPGNIKEKRCFIHRHKAPEFTQIKFACLCLRDQAWGLTHIEMIGFLRLIKEEGGRRKVMSSGEDRVMLLGEFNENRYVFK